VGPPGSGKSTICKRLEEAPANFQRSIVHIPVGGLIRKEIESGSPEGLIMKDQLERNCVVDSHITCNLIKTEMEKHPQAKVFLLDGHPYNVDNLVTWYKLLGSRTEYMFTIHLILERHESLSRVMSRCHNRADDTNEKWLKRYKFYLNNQIAARDIAPIVTLDARLPIAKIVEIVQARITRTLDASIDELFDRILKG
jgi:adenylate kinase family enzyme